MGSTSQFLDDPGNEDIPPLGIISTEDRGALSLSVEGDVLFENNASLNGVKDLISRVTSQADRVEKQLLPGKDRDFAVFKKESKKIRGENA